ncbi:MAG: hypothetical protein KJ933_02165, partial [Alphaproteobacteria bacterium]|nr:hypothetical protein [Alphaproteobacteria bacterium]
MDWTEAAIEKHREALKAILAGLVAMVASGAGAPRKILPRQLHRAVLSLLRPAESAARRLAIVLARRLGPLPAARRVAPKPRPSLFVREGVGTGILWKGKTPLPALLARAHPAKTPAPRRLSLPLLDPLKRFDRAARPGRQAGAPRISLFDGAARQEIPAWRPPLPDDPIDAGRLFGRLDALGRALDDLQGLARRFLRWQARRDLALGSGRRHR